MMAQARIDAAIARGDMGLEITGVAIDPETQSEYLTIPLGSAVDVLVDHTEEGALWLSEFRYMSEEGVRVETLEEHITDTSFVFRVTNEGGEEREEIYHPYFYGAPEQVKVTFVRRGVRL